MDEKNQQCDETLWEYIDGELSPGDTAELEAILESDSDLADELHSLEKMRSMLKDLPAERAPDGFADAVLQRHWRPHHREMLDGSRRAMRRMRWVLLATIIVVLLAAGMALLLITQL
jgi:anti-sigma factor RsiW